jgi:hypothetical protein
MLIRSALALATVLVLGSPAARAEPPIVREQTTSVRPTAPTPPPLQRYELIIKNRTTSPIAHVTAKSITMTNTSVNLLPNPIRVGKQGLVNLYDGKKSCEWAIRASLEDGRYAASTVNVCNLATWTVNNGDGNSAR